MSQKKDAFEDFLEVDNDGEDLKDVAVHVLNNLVESAIIDPKIK